MPQLAAELWKRIRPHLHLEDITEARPFGFGVGEHDVWRPYGINECIRFTKYVEGDHFAPHRDGPFVRTDEERSVHTVMAYLNDAAEYEGGETVFYSGNKSGELSVEHGEVVASTRGKRGTGLVFQHEMFHEGRALSRGVKYILRTDLMFVRVATSPLSSALQYAKDERYREAERLYQESIRLQKEGDPAGSTSAYLAALEMHAKLDAASAQYGPEYRTLPVDVWVDILGRLPMQDLLHGVWGTSKGWRALARHPTLWKFASHASVQERRGLQKTPLKDWYTLYRSHYNAKYHFRVIYADVGSIVVRYGMLGSQEPPQFRLSLVKASQGHYWSAGAGLGQHVCGLTALSYMAWYNDLLTEAEVPTLNINTFQVPDLTMGLSIGLESF